MRRRFGAFRYGSAADRKDGAQPIVTTPPDLPSLLAATRIMAVIDDIDRDLVAHAWTYWLKEAA